MREGKLRIVENEMTSELNVLAREAGRVARSHPMTADFTSNVLHRALKRSSPAFRSTAPMSTAVSLRRDRRDIDWAVAQARRHDPPVDQSVFDFLHAVLTTDLLPRDGVSHVAVGACDAHSAI